MNLVQDKIERFLRHKFIALMQNLGWKVDRIPASNRLNKTSGVFTDSYCRQHSVLEDYRQTIWRQSRSNTQNYDFSNQNIEKKRNRYDPIGQKQKALFIEALQPLGVNISQLDVLEIGCYTGAFLRAIQTSCKSVSGLDSSDLHDHTNTAEGKQRIKEYLKRIRNFSATEKQIPFAKRTGDQQLITYFDSKIEDFYPRQKWDLIISFDVFEHILDLEGAFTKIQEILRPDGYLITFYHPFFCETGAHFDRTGIPWGHCVLNQNDLNNYFDKFEAAEAALAKKSIQTDCNRLTRKDFYELADRHDLEIIDDYPIKIRDNTAIPKSYVQMARKLYPSVTTYDFLAEYCLIICKKKQ